MIKPDLRGGRSFSPDGFRFEAAHPAETGRYIVVFRDGATEKGVELLESLNLRLAVSPDAGTEVLKEDEAGDADVIVYPKLGVAVLAADPEQLKLLAEAALDSSSPVLVIEPERVRRVLEDVEAPPEGERILTVGAPVFFDRLARATARRVSLAAFDESQATWGLQITNTISSQFSGRGIRVAVLDTGIDLDIDAAGNVQFHPDFEGRTSVAETFVQGTTTARDGHGHGTHCLGIACGPLRPAVLPRYGVAYNAEIFVGKVATDSGDAPDGWIIAGIEWALSNGCRIVSLSIGFETTVGEPFSVVYETVALRALAAGLLIVAAAGNTGQQGPVHSPANCPSIMAVGAIDDGYNVAYFSSSGINPNGGEVDIVAPGVRVYSSYLLPKGHSFKSGTSASTPHVAGIAALYAEANPGVAGSSLWDLLIKPGNVHRLPFSPQYVGAGLVQAPR